VKLVRINTRIDKHRTEQAFFVNASSPRLDCWITVEELRARLNWQSLQYKSANDFENPPALSECRAAVPSNRKRGTQLAQNLYPERAAESSGGIVRFCAVVVHENRVETAITKQSAAEFSDS